MDQRQNVESAIKPATPAWENNHKTTPQASNVPTSWVAQKTEYSMRDNANPNPDTSPQARPRSKTQSSQMPSHTLLYHVTILVMSATEMEKANVPVVTEAKEELNTSENACASNRSKSKTRTEFH